MLVTATPTITIEPDSRADESELLIALKALLSLDFGAHDKRLYQCIWAAKQRIEGATGLLLEPATVSVQWSELYDYERLPNGPVTGAITITDLSGAALSGITLGTGFPTLTGAFPKGIALSYSAGYTPDTLPSDLLECVLNLAANLFDSGVRDWKTGLSAYRQFTWAQ